MIISMKLHATRQEIDEVRAQAERQRSYTSRHEHSPSQFGLAPERIRADLGFVYDAFGLSGTAS